MTSLFNIPINNIPIACEPTDNEIASRQNSLDALWAKVEGTQELADGYAFRFPNTDEIAQELLSFILAERQCCPFFQLELAFTPENGSTWLRLRGGDGVKQFVETELTAVLS